MVMNTLTLTNRKHGFRAIRQGEPEWSHEQRRRAWESYHDAPNPDRITHLWRYTKPEHFLISNPGEAMLRDVPSRTGSTGIDTTLSSGYSAHGISRADLSVGIAVADEYSRAGLYVSDLHSAAADHRYPVQEHLGKLVGEPFGKFESANLALWNAGFFVFVPDNTVVREPIYLSHQPLDEVLLSRSLVVIGRNSEVTIIDDYGSDVARPCPLANSVMEIFTGDSSRLRYISLSRFNETTPSIFTQRIRADRNSHVLSVFGSFGGSVTKVNAGAVLAGPGAESLMYGLAFGDGRQHLDHHTLHHHVSGETHSDLHVKVVLKDNSDSAYTGLIRIEEKADNSQAYQENRNLLLNEGTRAESVPELEILTDQVSCTHGATVGPIDPEMVFYLKSRGYSNDEATRTVVTGFVEPTIRLLPDDLQDMFRGLVRRKLEGK